MKVNVGPVEQTYKQEINTSFQIMFKDSSEEVNGDFRLRTAGEDYKADKIHTHLMKSIPELFFDAEIGFLYREQLSPEQRLVLQVKDLKALGQQIRIDNFAPGNFDSAVVRDLENRLITDSSSFREYALAKSDQFRLEFEKNGKSYVLPIPNSENLSPIQKVDLIDSGAQSMADSLYARALLFDAGRSLVIPYAVELERRGAYNHQDIEVMVAKKLTENPEWRLGDLKRSFREEFKDGPLIRSSYVESAYKGIQENGFADVSSENLVAIRKFDFINVDFNKEQARETEFQKRWTTSARLHYLDKELSSNEAFSSFIIEVNPLKTDIGAGVGVISDHLHVRHIGNTDISVSLIFGNGGKTFGNQVEIYPVPRDKMDAAVQVESTNMSKVVDTIKESLTSQVDKKLAQANALDAASNKNQSKIPDVDQMLTRFNTKGYQIKDAKGSAPGQAHDAVPERRRVL